MRIATICNMDAQGRITIPAVIRKAMHIADGEALEVESTGQNILLRKPQNFTVDSWQAQSYLDILHSIVPCGAMICSTEAVYASRGIPLPKNSPVPKELADYVASGIETVFDPAHPIFIPPHLNNPVTALFPIIRQSGHPALALILIAKQGHPLSDMELGSAKLVAVTLGHQLL
ncbi:MAG: AbrB/MazE/SpoVT family DNA-binding domain-containing protein [Eubacteriales bacterium]|nr:AbrB/MazE/SpoVT family DNA-binding domain-containing protein [Eubacteriales bacterium]